jgi:ubiquinone/menaquinone biosynthesis C-methylase UbiE
MPNLFGSGKNETRGTYAAVDNEKELARLTIQDRTITAAMGGVLSEQPDSTAFHHVLDAGCGTGGWLIQAAQTYPEMSLVGIDISKRMIEYARAQAEAHQVKDRVKFRVMDALLISTLRSASFDLVNLRFGVSFLRTWDWPKMLSELLWVARPGGVIRVTETEAIIHSSSPALTRLFEMFQSALFRSGHLFTDESAGLIDHLPRLLSQHGCQQAQTKAHVMEYQAGTNEGEAFYENMTLVFQTVRPFIQKYGYAAKDYETIYQQALSEMQQPDFHATWNILTAWGEKQRIRNQSDEKISA